MILITPRWVDSALLPSKTMAVGVVLQATSPVKKAAIIIFFICKFPYVVTHESAAEYLKVFFQALSLR